MAPVDQTLDNHDNNDDSLCGGNNDAFNSKTITNQQKGQGNVDGHLLVAQRETEMAT
jgi:hypothetical protein